MQESVQLLRLWRLPHASTGFHASPPELATSPNRHGQSITWTLWSRHRFHPNSIYMSYIRSGPDSGAIARRFRESNERIFQMHHPRSVCTCRMSWNGEDRSSGTFRPLGRALYRRHPERGGTRQGVQDGRAQNRPAWLWVEVSADSRTERVNWKTVETFSLVG